MKRILRTASLLIGLGLCMAGLPRAADTKAEAASARPRPVVALVTDFGSVNEAVGECHGSILSVDRNISIVDLSNNVKPFDIAEGARILAKPLRFPSGTVFVGVIDPGVGTKRRPIAIRTHMDFCYVAPDNGLLGDVIRSQEVVEAVELDPSKINAAWKPGTFDGRDLFSPAGAIIAASGGDLAKVGKAIDPKTLMLLKPTPAEVDKAARVIRGVYDRTDEPYGNIWTNVTPEDLAAAGLRRGDMLAVTIDGKTWTLPWVGAFGDVAKGETLAYLNSEGRLAFAVNMGDCRARWGAEEKSKIEVAPAPKQ